MSLYDQTSELLRLPIDQLQQILSYITLYELLALSQSSKSIHGMIDLTHHLCFQTSDASDQNMGMGVTINQRGNGNGNGNGNRNRNRNRRNSNADLRRSLPNLGNMDSMSSFSFEVESQRKSVYRRSDLNVTMLTHCLIRFHHIRSLQLYRLDHIGDKFLPILNAALTARTLTHLELHNIRIVKDGHTLNLPDDGDRLAYIELDGIMFCTYKILKSFTTSRNLQVLKMIGCRALMDADVGDIIHRQNKNQKLRELKLENCTKIAAPNIACPTLEILSLAKCSMLRDLSLVQCGPNLVHVDLSYCSLIGDGCVKSLIRQNGSIRTLSLKACRGVSCIDIDFQLESLQELDLSMCMSLKQCSLYCTALVTLEMGMCIKLETLDLSLSSIETLDLSMLTMKQVAIQAQELKILNLSGCCKLASIQEFICPSLVLLDICGTELGRKDFDLSKKSKTKIKTGGDGYDWTNPF